MRNCMLITAILQNRFNRFLTSQRLNSASSFSCVHAVILVANVRVFRQEVHGKLQETGKIQAPESLISIDSLGGSDENS